MATFISRFKAYLIIGLAGVLGGSSMLAFIIFLFVGSLDMVDLGLDEAAALILNAGLCLAFFVQHSTMIRSSVRRRLTRYLPEDYHGILYTIASGVVLLTLVLFWQESAKQLAAPEGIIRWLLRAIFFLSIAGVVWGMKTLELFDSFGFKPVLNRLHGTESKLSPLIIRGPYRWVRHPLYTFFLVMIWSCPDLTVDRLLFNVLFTIWMIIGAVLEERDLVAAFGEAYREYQRKVPMLIPYRIRPIQ
jgi:protein-S-isoprenylcysteine O-methyltransferase Ste14